MPVEGGKGRPHRWTGQLAEDPGSSEQRPCFPWPGHGLDQPIALAMQDKVEDRGLKSRGRHGRGDGQ